MKLRRVIIERVDSADSCLRVLRDTLVRRFTHRLAVAELTFDDIRCGFFVFDDDLFEAIWSGDEFRTYDNDEGEEAYQSAYVLFRLFGIKPLFWDLENFNEDCEFDVNKLFKIALFIGDSLKPEDFIVPAERKPLYVRQFFIVYNNIRKQREGRR